jgi:hypothetical protein
MTSGARPSDQRPGRREKPPLHACIAWSPSGSHRAEWSRAKLSSVWRTGNATRVRDGYTRLSTNGHARALPTLCQQLICRTNVLADDRACPRLPPQNLHGKEGVDGSSPSEGLQLNPANGHFMLPVVANLRVFAGTRRVHFGTDGHVRARATSRGTARNVRETLNCVRAKEAPANKPLSLPVLAQLWRPSFAREGWPWSQRRFLLDSSLLLRLRGGGLGRLDGLFVVERGGRFSAPSSPEGQDDSGRDCGETEADGHPNPRVRVAAGLR